MSTYVDAAIEYEDADAASSQPTVVRLPAKISWDDLLRWTLLLSGLLVVFAIVTIGLPWLTFSCLLLVFVTIGGLSLYLLYLGGDPALKGSHTLSVWFATAGDQVRCNLFRHPYRDCYILIDTVGIVYKLSCQDVDATRFFKATTMTADRVDGCVVLRAPHMRFYHTGIPEDDIWLVTANMMTDRKARHLPVPIVPMFVTYNHDMTAGAHLIQYGDDPDRKRLVTGAYLVLPRPDWTAVLVPTRI